MRPVTRYLNGALSIDAPAKINLFLHITGRRSDGYHLLESLFAFTHKGDRITVKPAPHLSLAIEGPFAGLLRGENQKNNLVYQAAALLQISTGCSLGAEITLEKNLPIASGIGGGSADAAATLIALEALWGLECSSEMLTDLALKLGADVPACLSVKPQVVSGIGDRMQPIELPKSYGVLLVNPQQGLSTPTVFKAYRQTAAVFDLKLPHIPLRSDKAFLGFLHQKTSNALLEPAVSLCPDIAQVKECLASLVGVQCVNMSGSGATVFALFEDPSAAAAAHSRVQQLYPEWWVYADRLVTR